MSHKSTSGDLRSKSLINAQAYICLYTYSWHWKRDNMPCIIFTLSIISFGQMCNDRQFKTLLGGLTYHLNFRALFQIALDIAVWKWFVKLTRFCSLFFFFSIESIFDRETRSIAVLEVFKLGQTLLEKFVETLVIVFIVFNGYISR